MLLNRGAHRVRWYISFRILITLSEQDDNFPEENADCSRHQAVRFDNCIRRADPMIICINIHGALQIPRGSMDENGVKSRGSDGR